jgi:Fe2+ transport system protein FeoA
MTLNEALEGRTYKVVEVPFCEPCDNNHEETKCEIIRLTELGIVPGESIRILQRLGDTARIEVTPGTELVLRTKMCKQIIIEDYA